ncbi:ABC transporter substrate-binding protein [Cryptosporangium phraense]|uniref:Substrate-binding domain-containing protein n=1 Tax=Cryptosporangium phraense TaxID=2593070 RepID=A0A545AWB2_9ACTN|nr:ABC transporter substrate-binding protein [Cryptosporangium phraense]TQS45619.1 substrate-binding domain-containing protein [Cryptosporangium phraense]
MKKAPFAVVCVAALALAACSSSKPDEDKSAASDNASAASSQAAVDKASKNYDLQFVQGVQGDEFYITMQCGIEEEARKLGVTVHTQGPTKFDPTLQKPIVDSVVSAKPDALLVAPTDVKAMQGPLNQAKAAGVKVVLVDTTVDDPSVAVSAIASDNLGGGKAAFEAIQKLAPQGGKVLAMGVTPGISTTDLRAKGFEDAVKADSKFKYVGIQYSNNDPATASQLISAALQKDPDIVGVFALNLFSAEGTATGIKQSGKSGKIQVVGFDAGPNQVAALRAGTVQALIAQQPAEIGKFGVDAAVASLDGGQVTAKVQTGFTILTKDNIDGDGAKAIYKSKC